MQNWSWMQTRDQRLDVVKRFHVLTTSFCCVLFCDNQDFWHLLLDDMLAIWHFVKTGKVSLLQQVPSHCFFSVGCKWLPLSRRPQIVNFVIRESLLGARTSTAVPCLHSDAHKEKNIAMMLSCSLWFGHANAIHELCIDNRSDWWKKAAQLIFQNVLLLPGHSWIPLWTTPWMPS